MATECFLSPSAVRPTANLLGGGELCAISAPKSDLETETARDKSLSPLETDAITIRPKLEDGAIHQAIYERMIR